MSLRLRAVEKSLRINFTRCAGKRAQAYFDRLIVGKISPESCWHRACSNPAILTKAGQVNCLVESVTLSRL